jgi:hypothetical protein
MGATLEIEYINGSRGERIIKELALVSDEVIQTYHFKPPYFMTPHSSKENGLTWNDGHIPYDQLTTVLTENTANYNHLCA